MGVVFGHVDFDYTGNSGGGEVVDCGRVLDSLEAVAVGRESKPKVEVTIVDCGVLEKKNIDTRNKDLKGGASQKNDKSDGNEISLDDDEAEIDLDDSDSDISHATNSLAPKEAPLTPSTSVAEHQPKKLLNPLQQRLRNLKMKMNQSRNLNRHEVLEEGRRRGMGDDDDDDGENGTAESYISKTERRKLMKEDRKNVEDEWKKTVMYDKGIQDDFMVEQANEVMAKAYKKAVTAKSNRFDMEDTHNPEGQQRNYQRNLKSVPKPGGSITAGSSSGIFDPTDPNASTKTSREGALRLAGELKRRADKSKAKRAAGKLEFEGEEVSAINKRNKKFNEKIGRTYDKYTVEIRQNLERGTAL